MWQGTVYPGKKKKYVESRYDNMERKSCVCVEGMDVECVDPERTTVEMSGGGDGWRKRINQSVEMYVGLLQVK